MANINTGYITIGDDTLVLQDEDLRSKKVSAFQSTPDDEHYPSEKLVKDSLDNKLNNSQKGANNGLAELGSDGKVPSSQLPTIPDVSTKYDTGDTASTALADADYIPFYDTSASGRRKTLWSNIKAKLKSYFDSIYLTTHQDISGKADKVGNATAGDIVVLGADGNIKDGGIPITSIEAVIARAHNHTNKTVLDKIPDIGTAGQVLRVNSSANGIEWGTPSGGGLSNYNFTHTANTTVSTSSTTITFAANQRSSQMITVSADIDLSIVCNNFADNYIWIKNNSSGDVDVTISGITLNGSSIAAANIRIAGSTMTVKAGNIIELGIVCNADGAFVTSRNDL